MGKVEIDHTGSGGGVTLSSDGTSLLLDGTAVGGGGDPDLYRDNASSATTPSATGSNAVAIGSNTEATGDRSMALIDGANAGGLRGFAVGFSATTSGSNSVAIGASAVSSGTQAMSFGALTDATGEYSLALGYTAQAITGGRATAISRAYASGTDSLAAAIASNSSSYGATDANTIAVGYQAKANAAYATSIGYNNTASGIGAAVFGATSSTSSGFRSLVVGGVSNTASGSYASVLGGQSNTASEAHAIAMGDGSTASHANSVSIGDSVQSTATNQINLGGTADTVRISETYTLPTSDGSANQVLTTDGSGAVTFADAGGGTPDLYAESYDGSSTKPTASGSLNAVAIGVSANASSHDTLALGESSTANANKCVAIGYNAYSSGGGGALAIGHSSHASAGTYANALGHNSKSIGQDATAIGQAYASGTDSLAAAIANNTSTYGATGDNSIAIGRQAKAIGGYGLALGAFANATATDSVAIGRTPTASGTTSIVLGNQSSATRSKSMALGSYAEADIDGKIAFAVHGFSNTKKTSQNGKYILVSDTADATAEAMTTTNSVNPTFYNQVSLNNNSAFAFHGTIVARESATDGTDCAAWKVEGLIRREGSAGTTVLVNSATTVLDNTPNWGMALSADTTNGCLKVQVTGAASTNIRWVATIETSELIYA